MIREHRHHRQTLQAQTKNSATKIEEEEEKNKHKMWTKKMKKSRERISKLRDACENILKCDELWLLTTSFVCVRWAWSWITMFCMRLLWIRSVLISLLVLFTRSVDFLSDFFVFFPYVCLFFWCKKIAQFMVENVFTSRCIGVPKVVILMVDCGWLVCPFQQ